MWTTRQCAVAFRGVAPSCGALGAVLTAKALASTSCQNAQCTGDSRVHPSSGSTCSKLHREISALRANPPSYLLAVGDPKPATLITNAYGALHWPTVDEGPWDVAATLQGDLNDAVCNEPLRVRLRFYPNWPQEPPLVRFHGFQIHPILDEDRGPPNGFYTRLPKNEAGETAVQEVLTSARNFFLDPLTALGLADIKDDNGRIRRLQNNMQIARGFNSKRLDIIRRYAPLARHPELFEWSAPLHAEWFAPSFWAASQEGTVEAWHRILTVHQEGQIFSMPLFSETFCDMLLEEIFNFYSSGLPANRPNSMNNYGIILNDIGLECFVNKIQELLQPIGDLLFPGAGNAWDGHHCFIVRYREDEDLGLDMHTDDSDVTFNICLGLEFTGAGLQFCGVQGSPDHRQHHYTFHHVKGHCVVHLGRKRHGADDIASGERLNLILWNHSSAFRRSKEYQQPDYHREAAPPSPVCVSYTHDRDYGNFKTYPKDQEHFKGRGWCPPQRAEYTGFTPDSQQSNL